MNSNHALDDGCQVHVWKYCLQRPVDGLSLNWFSPEEKFELVRLKRYNDRKQYLQVHGFLKRVLEIYTHLPPDQIHFDNDKNGKPFLKCDHERPPVYFSLSYRHDYALLAVSNEPSIGVDIEEVKPIENLFPFLVTLFSKSEREKILSEKTEKKKLSTLFSFWTMKEAFVKALGIGFSESIKKYEVLPFLKKPLGSPDFDLSTQWCMHWIPVAKNYKAALSVKARKVNRKIFDYSDSAFIFQ